MQVRTTSPFAVPGLASIACLTAVQAPWKTSLTLWVSVQITYGWEHMSMTILRVVLLIDVE